MAGSNRHARAAFIAALMASVAAAPLIAAAQENKIGVAAATNSSKAAPNVTGEPPTGEKRIVEVGTNMLANERITTTANGQAQFLFNDGSSFSVGPDSDLTLDKFVYDPEKGTGEMSLSVTKGVLRFVGGKISKTNAVEVKAGTATMGIRGGIATLSYQPGQPITAKFLFGQQMTMTANGVTQVTTRPGTAIDTPPGQAPAAPRTVTPQEMRQTMSAMEAKPAAAPTPAADSGGGGQQQQQQQGGGGQQNNQQQGGSGQQQAAGPAPAAASGGGGDAPAPAAPPAAPPPAQIEARLDTSGLSNLNSGSSNPVVPVVNPITGGGGQPQSPAQTAPVVETPRTDNIRQPVISQQTRTTTTQTTSNTPLTLTGVQARTVLDNNGSIRPYTGFNPNTLQVTPDSETNFTSSNPTTNGSAVVTTTTTTTINETLTDGVVTSSSSSSTTTTSSSGSTTPTQMTFLSSAGNMTLPLGTFGGETSFGGLLEFNSGTPVVDPYTGFSGQMVRAHDFEDFFFYNLHRSSDDTRLYHFGGTPTQRNFLSGLAVGTYTYSMLGSADAAPFVGDTFSFTGSRNVSNLFYRHSNVSQSSAVFLQSSIGISGQGLNQTSFMTNVLGQLLGDADHDSIVPAGALTGTLRETSFNSNTRLLSSVSATQLGNGQSAVFGDSADFWVLSPGQAVAGSRSGEVLRTDQAGFAQRLDILEGSDFTFTDIAIRNTTQPAIATAPSRTTRELRGYAAALVERRMGNGSFISTNDSAVGTAIINTSLSANRLQATFSLVDNNAQTYSLQFGGLTGNNFSTSAFINDSVYGARASTTIDSTIDSASVAADSALVSSDVAPFSGTSFSPVNFCNTCQDLTWGWWTSEMVNGDGDRYRVHLSTYVAGTEMLVAHMPTTGVATYSGQMIGNVQTGSLRYLAMGNYTQTWNFGTRSGVMSSADFDGFGLGGTLLGSSNSNAFSGAISGGHDGTSVSGSLFGNFFAASGNHAQGSVGGVFELIGDNISYQATGTFAAGSTTFSTVTQVMGQTLLSPGDGTHFPFTDFNNQNLSITRNNDLFFDFQNTVIDAGASTSTVRAFLSEGTFNVSVPGTPENTFFTGTVPDLGASKVLFGFRAAHLPDFYFFDIADTSNANFRLAQFAGTPTTPSLFPTSGLGAHVMSSGFDDVPLAGGLLNGFGGNVSVSPLYSAYGTRLTPTDFLGGAQRSVNLFAALGISGQGGEQSSFLLGQTGNYINDPVTGLMSGGGMQGSIRTNGDLNTTRITSAVSTASVGGTGNALFGPGGDYLVLSPDNINVDTNTGTVTRTSQAAFQQPSNDLNGDAYYFYSVAARASNPAILTEPTRTLRTVSNGNQLNGVVAGMMEFISPTSGVTDIFRVFNASGSTDNVVIETDPGSNRMAASFHLGGGEISLDLAFGSITGANNGRSAFINDRLFGARDSTATNSLVEGNVVNARSLLVTTDLVPNVDASFFPAGVSFCTSCDDLVTGWWLTDIRLASNDRLRTHMGTFVVGDVTPEVDLPVSGSATFSGHALGTVLNNGSMYLAIGSYTQVWNFATRSGLAHIGSFDGRNLQAAVQSVEDINFGGNFDFGGAAFSGSMQGFFFSGTNHGSAGSVGGAFGFQSNDFTYQAAGTFAAGPLLTQQLGLRGRYLRDVNSGPHIYNNFNQTDLSVTFDTAQYHNIGPNTAFGNLEIINNDKLYIPNGQGEIILELVNGDATVDTTNAFSRFGFHTGNYFMSFDGDDQLQFVIAGLRDISQPQNISAFFAGTPTLEANLPSTGLRQLQVTSGAASIPFASDLLTPVANSAVTGATISPFFAAQAPVISGSDALGGNNTRSVMLQASLGFDGVGAGQTSFLSGATTWAVRESSTNAPMFAGVVRGSAVGNGGLQTSFGSGLATAQIDGGSAIFGETGQHLVFVPDQVNVDPETGLLSRVNSAANETVFPVTSGPTDYYFLDFTRPMNSTAVLTAPNRTTQTLSGFVGGLLQTRNSSGTQVADSVIANSNGAPSDVTISTNATTNRLSAQFNYTASLGAASGTTYQTRFGSLTGIGGGDSAFVNDALMAAAENGNDTSTVNDTNASSVTRAFMVSHSVAPVNPVSIGGAGSAFCDCTFMQWGWWTADVQHVAGEADRVHLATWVAGNLAQVAEIPTTGTATYTGHAIGNVNNNGNRYVALGNFSQAWNFGTRTGSATITNFDGKDFSFSGIVGASGGAATFSGSSVSGTVTGGGSSLGSLSGAINGAMFKSTTDAAAGVGGNFAVTNNSNYTAAGTFVAKR